jgi:hypothetical protein
MTQAANFDGRCRRAAHVIPVVGTLQQLRGLFVLGASSSPETVDDRLLRGGPLTRKPTEWQLRSELTSDTRRAIVGELEYEYNRNAQREWRHTVSLGHGTASGTSAVRIQLQPEFARQYDVDQYVTDVRDALATRTYGRAMDLWRHRPERTVGRGASGVDLLAHAHLAAVGAALRGLRALCRASRNSAPRVSSPSTCTGAAAARSCVVPAPAATRSWSIPMAPAGRHHSPSRSRTSSCARCAGMPSLRWEYRPGSTLLPRLAATTRGGRRSPTSARRATSAASFRDPARNVFLLKVSYWLGR